MKAIKYSGNKEVDKCLNELITLDIELDIKQKVKLINKIFSSLFKPGKSGGKKNYDYLVDYRLIWDSFKGHRLIDLNKDKINWWEFSACLEGLLLEGGSSIAKVVEIRQTKIPKQDKYNKEYIQNLRSLKSNYALAETGKKNKVLGDLFNFLKIKAGEKNGRCKG